MRQEYGVFTSPEMESAHTPQWALCFYCSSDKAMIGSKLYHGTAEEKNLMAICEKHAEMKSTVYAYKKPNGQIHSNDETLIKSIGTNLSIDISTMRKIDDIKLSEPFQMLPVSVAGIEKCLRQWRMGTSYRDFNDGFLFQMVTSKIEYVYMISEEDNNIYCGASVNIPYKGGLFGSGQYFRLRNFADNSKPYCGFNCDMGYDLLIPTTPDMLCKSGACTTTSQGIFWPIKRYSEFEIVLEGCDGNEYIYKGDEPKSEYFTT